MQNKNADLKTINLLLIFLVLIPGIFLIQPIIGYSQGTYNFPGAIKMLENGETSNFTTSTKLREWVWDMYTTLALRCEQWSLPAEAAGLKGEIEFQENWQSYNSNSDALEFGSAQKDDIQDDRMGIEDANAIIETKGCKRLTPIQQRLADIISMKNAIEVTVSEGYEQVESLASKRGLSKLEKQEHKEANIEKGCHKGFYVATPQMPKLKGGISSLQSKVQYPKEARETGIEGRVVVQFIVDKQGRMIKPSVIRGLGDSFDEEAARVVSMAKFEPGFNENGLPVCVQYSLPITFRLQH